MPAANQIEAVSKKLKELNSEFDGKISRFWDESGPPVLQDGDVVEVRIFIDKVTDLSPLRAFSKLREIFCHSRQDIERRVDLSSLNGMRLLKLVCVVKSIDLATVKDLPLSELACFGSGITDLTPISGMRLRALTVSGNWDLRNLEPLKEMPLTFFACDNTQVADLSPLRGMRLTQLLCHVTKVSDLSPLKGMPLEVLSLEQSPIADLSPLAGMKLKRLSFTPSRELKGLQAIRQMESLVEIGTEYTKPIPSQKFWKQFDEGAFNSTGDFKPVTDVKSPESPK